VAAISNADSTKTVSASVTVEAPGRKRLRATEISLEVKGFRVWLLMNVSVVLWAWRVTECIVHIATSLPYA
jgi:hypothetical protein